jgi:hypothetical protein
MKPLARLLLKQEADDIKSLAALSPEWSLYCVSCRNCGRNHIFNNPIETLANLDNV